MSKIAPSLSLCVSALIALASQGAAAGEQPYYNPANAASSTGMTTDYELYKTIGCPGQGLLETPCDSPVKATPVVAAVATPKPVYVEPVKVAAPVEPTPEPQAPVVALNSGTQSTVCQFVFPYQGVTPQTNPWLPR